MCYGAAIAAAAGRGSWQQAIALLGRMRAARLEVPLPALNAALHACAKAKLVRVRVRVRRAPRRSAKANPNPNPNPNLDLDLAIAIAIAIAITLTLALPLTLPKAKRWEEALHLLHAMRAGGGGLVGGLPS